MAGRFSSWLGWLSHTHTHTHREAANDPTIVGRISSISYVHVYNICVRPNYVELGQIDIWLGEILPAVNADAAAAAATSATIVKCWMRQAFLLFYRAVSLYTNRSIVSVTIDASIHGGGVVVVVFVFSYLFPHRIYRPPPPPPPKSTFFPIPAQHKSVHFHFFHVQCFWCCVVMFVVYDSIEVS